MRKKRLIDRLEKALYEKCIKKFDTQEQIAEFLGVVEKTVRNKIRKYKLKYIKHVSDKPEGYFTMCRRYSSKED